KDDVIRRLFQRFQQGIKGRLAEHVHLINDVYLVAPVLRRNADAFTQIANVVHLVIGGRVDLNYVQRTVERFAIYLLINLVDGTRQYACHRGFAHPARAAEHISMGQTVLADSIFKRTADMLLRYDIIEGSGTVSTG